MERCLIREAHTRAVGLGLGAVLLVGDPNYYGRFGYRPSITFGIANADGFDARNVVACELMPASLRGVAGTVRFPK